MQVDQEGVTSCPIRRHFVRCSREGSRRMTNAWADWMVAGRDGAPGWKVRPDAAALSVATVIGGNAGEMGLIRGLTNARNSLRRMPAALLCRTFYLNWWTGRPVDNRYRSAATGTLNAL